MGSICSARLVGLHLAVCDRYLFTPTYSNIRTIPAVSLRLYYIYHHNYLNNGGDESSVAITTAIAMNTSIVVTCIPFLKPLMEQLQSGWATSDIRHGIGYNLTYSKKSEVTRMYINRFPKGSVIASKASQSKKIPSIAIGAT